MKKLFILIFAFPALFFSFAGWSNPSFEGWSKPGAVDVCEKTVECVSAEEAYLFHLMGFYSEGDEGTFPSYLDYFKACPESARAAIAIWKQQQDSNAKAAEEEADVGPKCGKYETPQLLTIFIQRDISDDLDLAVTYGANDRISLPRFENGEDTIKFEIKLPHYANDALLVLNGKPLYRLTRTCFLGSCFFGQFAISIPSEEARNSMYNGLVGSILNALNIIKLERMRVVKGGAFVVFMATKNGQEPRFIEIDTEA